MHPDTKKKLAIVGGVGALTAIGVYLSQTFLKPKDESLITDEVATPYAGYSSLYVPETPATPDQQEPIDYNNYIPANGGLPGGSLVGGTTGFTLNQQPDDLYGQQSPKIDKSGTDTSPDVGVVLTAKYPTTKVTEIPSITGSYLPILYPSETVQEARSRIIQHGTSQGILGFFDWLGKSLGGYKTQIIPNVEAQITNKPVYKATPSATIPEGFVSSPSFQVFVPSSLPSIMQPSNMKTSIPTYTPKYETTTPVKIVQTNPFKKPSWLG